VPGPKTNEREGTRAVLRFARISPYKVREVLDLIRGKPVGEAEDILRFTERDAGIPVGKVLRSAIANAETNDSQDPEDLYVSACFADEGTTIKRWRPRARGRATRIRKRTSHITIIVSRLPEDELVRLQARRQAEQSARRARRVAGARRAAGEGGRNRASRRRRGGAEEEPIVAEEPAVEPSVGEEEEPLAEAVDEESATEPEPLAEAVDEETEPQPADDEPETEAAVDRDAAAEAEPIEETAEDAEPTTPPDTEKGK
jgi:large subunit ribosomal protein L22